jgi:hypothetical protein
MVRPTASERVAPPTNESHAPVRSGLVRGVIWALAALFAVLAALSLFAGVDWQFMDDDVFWAGGSSGVNYFGAAVLVAAAILLAVGQPFLGGALGVFVSVAALGSHLMAAAGDETSTQMDGASSNGLMLAISILTLALSAFVVWKTRPRLRG